MKNEESNIDFNKIIEIEKIQKNINENQLKGFFNKQNKNIPPLGIILDYDIEQVKKEIFNSDIL